MAELARAGGVVGCPTEISECFCNLEVEDSGPGAGGSTTGRRKLRGSTGPMLLHLTPKQLLVARKPTLMDDLITRNKTALLRNKMERTRSVKNKRSDADSESDLPLAVKRLRSNDPIEHKRSKSRKRDPEEKKNRMTTRRFTSSLRSGKKRAHIRDAGLLVKKRKTLKSSGSRSNESETDVPSANSLSKPNGHPLILDKEKKTDKATVPVSKAKPPPAAESKPSSSKEESCKPTKTVTKKIRKKRRKVDSMVWLKKQNRPKQHNDSKPLVDIVIKTEPVLSQSEPEDSGLGSEVKLDLSKVDERLSQDQQVCEDIKSTEWADKTLTPGIVASGTGKPVWNIEPFLESPIRDPVISESEFKDKSNGSGSVLPTLTPNLESPASPDPEDICMESENLLPSKLMLQPCEELTESQAPLSSDEIQNAIDLPSSPDISDTVHEVLSTCVEEADVPVTKDSPEYPDLVNCESELVNCESTVSLELEKKMTLTLDVAVDQTQASDDLTLCSQQLDPAETVSEQSDPVPCEVLSQSQQAEASTSKTEEDNSLDNENETMSVKLDDTSITTSQADITIDSQLDESFELRLTDSEEAEVSECIIEERVEQVKEISLGISEKQILEESIKIEETLADTPPNECDENENKSQENLNANLPQCDRDFNSSSFDDVPATEIKSNNGDIDHKHDEFNSINGKEDFSALEENGVKFEEGVERQALKADLLKALGLQSLRPVSCDSTEEMKEFKEEKSSKLTEPGYTGTLKAVIKLNKGAPRSIVFKNNEDTFKPEYQICSEAPVTGVPITHMVDVVPSKKPKEIVTDFEDTVSNSSCVSTAPAQSDSGESEDEKPHGKESNLIIPEKSSSFSIHPGRLCSDVCCYCFGKFGSLDTPCHIAQIKLEERQQKILQNEPYLTVDSCLCDACYRYVDRKVNCPPTTSSKSSKRARPPAATLCCVTDCTLLATHSVKRKWLLKIKRSLANKFEIDTEKHTSVFNPLCSNHHYWVDYYMVCGICRKRLNRNHLYTLGPETDRLNLVLAEDGIPARLSDKLFLCKLCRYYASMRLKYSDTTTIPAASQPFYTNYRKKILASLDVPVSDSDEDKPKAKEGKDEDVMSLSGLATLLSDQPDPNHPRIQVKFGNVNIGTLSNLNIGQGRQEERTSYDRSEPTLPLNASFDFQGPSTSDGSWEKVTSTLQFDKKTKQLWQDLQRPYGNQSSFLRHLVMLERYWRSGYLVLSETADPRAAKYINSVQTRNKSFEGKSETKEFKIETPPPPPTDPSPPQEPIIKVPDPAKRFLDEKPTEPPKSSQPFCPIIPTGEVEVLPVNPNKVPPKEKHISKGTLIIQRPAASQSQSPSNQNPCKIMITSVQSLAKPKVDPVLLNRAKSLVRMVSPGVSRQRVPVPVPIQRLQRPPVRSKPMQYMQPYQTLQAQLQAPPPNHPHQTLQQVVLNRYPPPPLVKINQQVTCQQRVPPTSKPQSSQVMMHQQHSNVSLMHQQSQNSMTLLQHLHQPSVSLIQQHSRQQTSSPPVSILQQLQPSVSLHPHQQSQQQNQQMLAMLQHQQQQPISILQQQHPSVSVQLQSHPSVSIIQNQAVGSHQKSGPPPPYPMRSFLPRLPPSLSISTQPQTSIASLTPSVSLLPPSSSNGVVSSSSGLTPTITLPPISTLTSCSQLTPPPPYSTPITPPTSTSSPVSTPLVIPPSSLGPSITMIPSSITLPSSGITIEKQPHNFHTPPILPPEKPIISVFREPLPTDT